MLDNLALGSEKPLLKWSRWSFILALALFPIVLVPVAWFPFQLTKIAVFCVLLAISAVMYGLTVWRDRSVTIPASALPGAVLAFVASVAVSTILSQNPSASLIGEATEFDTLFFSILAAATFFLGSFLFRKRENVYQLLSALLVSGLVVGVFQVLQIVFGPNLLGIDVLVSTSTNLVGKWNDLGVVMALVAAASMLFIDVLRPSRMSRILAVVCFALALAFLALVNLSVAWWALLVAAILAAALAYTQNTPAAGLPPVSLIRRLPFASIVVVIVAGVFLVWGVAINTTLSTWASISEFEVRPSTQATTQIMRDTYAQSTFTTLFGSGPGTFTEQWLLFKPNEVNLSNFWNLDFQTGSGTIPTQFITLGVVGGVLLLLLPLLLLLSAYGLRRRVDVAPEDRAVALSVALLTLTAFLLSFLYATNQFPLLVAFALLGAYVALARTRSEHTLSFAAPGAVRYFAYIALALIFIVPLGAFAVTSQRLTAGIYLGRAILAATSDDLDTAEKYGNQALAIRRTDDALRFISNVHVARAQKTAASTEGTQEARAQKFQQQVGDAISFARAAVTESPRDYNNWLTLARIYEGLIPAQVQGAYQSAEQTYVEAIRRNPRNPGLYLAAARMEGAAGAEQPLRDAVNQALTLKPNYTDAVLLIVQLEIAKNNLQGAINAAAAAVQTAPDNAGLWAELGLLALNANAPADAASAFEQALKLIPDYANAKYFLGLAYYQLGRTADSAGLFTELAAANPDNQEVALILSNIRAGKAPFAGVQGANPTQPTTPPIKEQ